MSEKAFQEIDVNNAYELYKNNKVVVVDVRNPDEYWGETGHIKGSIFIPLDTLENNYQKLEPHKDKQILVFCYSGTRSKEACELLAQKGFMKLYNVVGGMMEWTDNNYEVEGQNLWPNPPA